MKTIWTALAFVAACTGVILGTGLRARQESGANLFSTSELLALRSGNSQTSEDSPWFPATAYYDQVRRIIEAEYVVPVVDKTNMARTSLRYLLRSLGDPETRYYEPEQWRAYTGRLQGVFEGIGADVLAQESMTPTGVVMPLRIISVAPGGPGEQAGLKTGDIVESIDGRWVASRSLFDELQKASDSFTAGKITRKRYDEIWQGIRDRSERMMSVEEATEQLQSGTGKIEMEIKRGAETLQIGLTRMVTEVAPVVFDGTAIRLRNFGPGSGAEFAQIIESDSPKVVDLRGNPGGSFEEVKKALSAVLRKGAFATVRNDPKAPLEKLRIDRGVDKPAKLTVLVDKGTAREAELFAVALRDGAGAKLEGGPMAGLARRVQRYALPDGSGYAITSGHYHDLEGASLVREDAKVKEARRKAMEAAR
ncbi:MAG: S41 family peptidase [Fimbriimonadales bacterium]